MKIAVPFDHGEIFQHFGHTGYFAVYTTDSDDTAVETKVLIDSSSLHGHKQMADLMHDNGVDVVICGHIGDEARAALMGYGILPFFGYEGDADTAVDMLLDGSLLMLGMESGGCGGGCGGCGGHCGEDHHCEHGCCDA